MDDFFHHVDLLSVWNRHSGPWFNPWSHANAENQSISYPKRGSLVGNSSSQPPKPDMRAVLKGTNDPGNYRSYFDMTLYFLKAHSPHKKICFTLYTMIHPPTNIMTPSKFRLFFVRTLMYPFLPFQIPVALWRSLCSIFFRNETHFGLLEISSSSTCLDTVAVASNLTNKQHRSKEKCLVFIHATNYRNIKTCLCMYTKHISCIRHN